MSGFLLALQVAVIGIVALGTTLVLGSLLDPAALLALMVVVTRCVDSLVDLAEMRGVIAVTVPALRRCLELEEVASLPEPASPQSPIGFGIEVDGVDFRYDAAASLALEDVRVRIPARTMTAVVGPSGAGKSTLLALLARAVDPESGEIRVGGLPLQSIGSTELMRHVSIVPQNAYLFRGSLAENVRVGSPDAPDEQVLEAARSSRLDEVVERLPEGWQTQVGDGGGLLSGGERQRVALARAFLKGAPIVLFDEATASLDAQNDAAVAEAIELLRRERTVVLVAHRLAHVRTADQIVVLDEGRVTQVGTHDELRDVPGRYADLWSQYLGVVGWHLDRVTCADFPSPRRAPERTAHLPQPHPQGVT